MRIPPADGDAPAELLPECAVECGARAAAPDEEVTQLFGQHRDPLFRYLLSLGLSTQDGEEVIQEVFLALFQHLKQGKPRDHRRGWIFRVGHNQALKLRQRHAVWPGKGGWRRRRKRGLGTRPGAAGAEPAEAAPPVGGDSRLAATGSGVGRLKPAEASPKASIRPSYWEPVR